LCGATTQGQKHGAQATLPVPGLLVAGHAPCVPSPPLPLLATSPLLSTAAQFTAASFRDASLFRACCRREHSANACCAALCRVWCLRTGAPLAALQGHQGDVCCVALGPGSRFMVTVGDGTDRVARCARVWSRGQEEECTQTMGERGEEAA
jgi:hypothetical protein